MCACNPAMFIYNYASQFCMRHQKSPPYPRPVVKGTLIGHFGVPKTLTFKTRLSAKPFAWKGVLFA